LKRKKLLLGRQVPLCLDDSIVQSCASEEELTQGDAPDQLIEEFLIFSQALQGMVKKPEAGFRALQQRRIGFDDPRVVGGWSGNSRRTG
jgi:hypothetical protein